MDGGQVFARLVFSQPLSLGQGFCGALRMRLLVVSGESETAERRKKGLMVLRWARLGRSQTRVPGLALSCPYHCTSASSEQRGLLRKQLSLKDLQGKHQQHEDEDFRGTWVILKQAIWNLFHQMEEYNPGHPPGHTLAPRGDLDLSLRTMGRIWMFVIQYATQGLWGCTNPCVLITQIPGKTG